MKISTLKFKEIFEKTHAQIVYQQCKNQFSQNKRGNESQFSMKESFFSTNSSYPIQQIAVSRLSNNRPKTARNFGESRKSVDNKKISHLCKKMDPKKTEIYKQNSQFLAIIEKQILKCIESRSESQLFQIGQQINTVHTFCRQFKSSREQKQATKIFSIFEQAISKYITNRISRILFYLTYIKYLECLNNEEYFLIELQKLHLCEYYSRCLSLFSLTLFICLRIQALFINLKEYDQARKYARKSLRIAVYLKNKTVEFQIIENFKILSYYTGVLNKYNKSSISKQEREIIMKTYSILDDIPEIRGISSENQFKRRTSIVYEPQDMRNTGALEEMEANVANFITNLTHMNKQLTDHSKNIKKTIKKVGSLGQVKKYLKDGNYITLQPRSRNVVQQNQSQVLLTNLGRNATYENQSAKYFKQYLPKYVSLIKSLMSHCNCITHLKLQNNQYHLQTEDQVIEMENSTVFSSLKVSMQLSTNFSSSRDSCMNTDR